MLRRSRNTHRGLPPCWAAHQRRLSARRFDWRRAAELRYRAAFDAWRQGHALQGCAYPSASAALAGEGHGRQGRQQHDQPRAFGSADHSQTEETTAGPGHQASTQTVSQGAQRMLEFVAGARLPIASKPMP